MSTYELSTGASMAAFWACRDAAHSVVHFLARDDLNLSDKVRENQELQLAWTIEALTPLLGIDYDPVKKLPEKCWTRPEAEGGIALCDHPLDADTVRRIVDAALATATAGRAPEQAAS